MDSTENIKQNIEKILETVRRINADAIVMGVTKTVEIPEILTAYEAGLRHFGESKVQESATKIYDVNSKAPGIKWHFIGHLQTNKVNKAVENFTMIQSVDSVRLAKKISVSCQKAGRDMDILLEVKISEEETKHGMLPENVIRQAEEISELSCVNVKGLMTIAPYSEESEYSRKYFRETKRIFDTINKAEKIKGAMEILSMGMTGDYIPALEEGANMVRIGSGIFGRRNYG